MGSLQAAAMADTDLTLEQALAWHLRSNHYPAVPSSMVPTCIEAINAYWEDDLDKMVSLPAGVFFRGEPVAPARAIIISHHLDTWCAEED
jgi:hypothetical protein